MQFGLEIGLAVLLALTLVQAIRLERALGVLRRARAGLEPLVEEFDGATRHAEAAIARLHEAAETAGRQVGRQSDTAASLKDDLAFLVERGDRLADRLDGLVRSARPLAGGPRLVADRAKLERMDADRQLADRIAAERLEAEAAGPDPALPERMPGRARVRSQAERDLLKALRVAR
jgi:hypothetical protein